MARVLVAGLLIYNSGKTWLGVSLIRRLISYGARVGVFKPVAGHDAWSQYRTVVESFKRGVLVGEDVIEYTGVVGDIDVALVNPIDVLLAPPDLVNYLSNVYSYLEDLENQFKQAVLARMSLCSDGSTQHFVFKENLVAVPPPLRDELERLSTRLNAINSGIGDFIERLRGRDIEDELMKCLKRVEMGREVTVIESFNNAIAPFKTILSEADLLLVVAPSVVAIYRDVKEAVTAVDEAVKSYGERGFEAVHLLSKVKPSEVLYIKPRRAIDEYDESIESLARMILSIR